jgi:hypothetical protein
MPETDADRFRQKAEECRRLAERSASQVDKEAWLRLAADWIKPPQFTPAVANLICEQFLVKLERDAAAAGMIAGSNIYRTG